MSADKRQRFELLMKQAELPTELIGTHFQDGHIEKVQVSPSNREWTFFIRKSTLLRREIYTVFCRTIREKFKHLADSSFCFIYDDQIASDELCMEYWPLFVEWAQQEMASVNGWLAKSVPSVSGGVFQLSLPDKAGLELAKRKKLDEAIGRFYADRFSRTVRVKLTASEASREMYEEFAQRVVQENNDAVMQIMTSVASEALPDVDEGDVRLAVGYDIREEPVPLMNIVEEEKKTTVQGTVFGLEVKELRNGSTLFTFNVTDFTDSMAMKMFAKTKEDVKILSKLSNGKWIKARGRVEYDRFMQEPELVMMPNDLHEVVSPRERMDSAEVKRVEFHLHTTMSTMDAVTSVDTYIKTAAKWGHSAIAVTDHGNVQCYPDAFKHGKKNGIKVLFGVEANVINDAVPMVLNPREESLKDAEYVVFDIETTGLSITNCKIIELAGVKYKNGEEIGRFATFIDPHEKIPYHIQQLTNITDDMVRGAPELEPKLREFIEFARGSVLVAHNARFDMGFIQASCKGIGIPEVDNPVLDTLELARFLHPGMKNHRLNTLAAKYKSSLESHHRAIDDSIALAGILYGLIGDAAARSITGLHQLNDYVGMDLSNSRPFHCNIYALNAVGKKNLFKLISLSHTEHFKRVACIPKSKLTAMREGLLVISGCEKSEFFEAVLNKTLEEAEEIAGYYDVLEIQPVEFYMHLVDKGLVGSRAEIEGALRNVCGIGDKLGKPVIATGNVHYLNPSR